MAHTSCQDNVLQDNLYTPDYLTQDDICRFCWAKNSKKYLLDNSDKSSELIFKIEEVLGIELLAENCVKNPNKVCETCLNKIESFYEFKHFCQMSQLKLYEILGDVNQVSMDVGDRLQNEVKVEKADVLPNLSAADLLDNLLGSLSNNSDEHVIKNRDAENANTPEAEMSLKTTEINESLENTAVKRDPVTKEVVEVDKTQKQRRKQTASVRSKYVGKRAKHFCNLCKCNFSSSKKFATHNSVEHGREKDGTFRCFGCPKRFRSKTHRRDHERNVCKGLKDGYKCAKCERFLQNRRLYEEHMRKHKHNIDVELPENIFKCMKCPETFKSNQELLQHAVIHRPEKKNKKKPSRKSEYYCHICYINLEDEEVLTNHKLVEHGLDSDGMYKCFGCPRKFERNQTRAGHERLFCKGLKDGFKCSQCEKFMPNRKMYEKHMRNHRENKLIDLPEDLFKCKKCGASFNNNEELRKHNSTHRAEYEEKRRRDYVCEVCSQIFTQSQYLARHIKIAHLGIPQEKKHQCPHCDYRATLKTSLVIHIRKHTGERPYACDLCPLRCVSISNLRAHRRRHTEPPQHQCHICPKKFGYKATLLQHIEKVHERPQQQDQFSF